MDVPSLVDDIMRMKCLASVQTNIDKTLNISAVHTVTKKQVTLQNVSPDKTNDEILRIIIKELNQ